MSALAIMRETLLSIFMSVVMALTINTLVFRGIASIRLDDPATARGMAIQTFAVVLMSIVMPTLILRRQRRAGLVQRSYRRFKLPRNLFLKAGVPAIVLALLFVPSYPLIASLADGRPLSHTAFLVFAVGHAAVVAAIITPVAIFAVLAEP